MHRWSRLILRSYFSCTMYKICCIKELIKINRKREKKMRENLKKRKKHNYKVCFWNNVNEVIEREIEEKKLQWKFPYVEFSNDGNFHRGKITKIVTIKYYKSLWLLALAKYLKWHFKLSRIYNMEQHKAVKWIPTKLERWCNWCHNCTCGLNWFYYFRNVHKLLKFMAEIC